MRSAVYKIPRCTRSHAVQDPVLYEIPLCTRTRAVQETPCTIKSHFSYNEPKGRVTMSSMSNCCFPQRLPRFCGPRYGLSLLFFLDLQIHVVLLQHSPTDSSNG